MGLLTRISNVFGAGSSRRSAGPVSSSNARRSGSLTEHASPLSDQTTGDALEGLSLAESKLGTATLDDPLEDASDEALRAVSRRVDLAPPPRTKQELFEDLQKNYREAVELIRKVDGHLDRDETRAEQLMTIARRVDDTLPSLERTPEHLARLGEQIVEAIRASAAADEKRVARIEDGLGRIVSTLERSSGAQVELTATMAAFRETLTDIDHSNRRSAQALESMDHRRAAREDEIARMLATSKVWMLVALILSVAMGTVAMAIAIVSMVTAP